MINQISSFVGILSQGVRRIICGCLLVVFASNMLLAQNIGKISGVVKDANTGEPLIGCNITLAGTKLGATSQLDGSFFILNVSPGKYDIKATMIGYQKVIQQNAIVNSGKTTVVDFLLKTTTYEQAAVVIEATRPDVEKEKTSTSTIIRADDVAALAGMRDVSDVIGLAADVTDGHFRGGRDGEELYTLQGMGLTNPLDNGTAFVPIMSAVEEVEVITSGFGAQYGNAQSGVVNITMKEGKSDKWRSSGEFRMRGQGMKHFGSSIYDPNSNPTLGMLLNGNTVWLGEGSDNTKYYTQYGLSSLFGSDSIYQGTKLAAAKALWAQSKRDIGLKYGLDPDYSVEATAGGPLTDKVRLFIAFRSKAEWPVLPTEDPDLSRQLMGNLAFDIGKGASLRLTAAYGLDNENVFPSFTSALGFYDQAFDRIHPLNYDRSENIQLGARFTQALSPSTFYEIKISSLATYRRTGSATSPSYLPDSLVYPNSTINYSYMLIEPIVGFDKYGFSSPQSYFRNEHTRTYSLDASLTSQVDKFHLLNGGVQFNAYSLDVNNASSVFNSKPVVQKYTASPTELGIYIQDKMEFEGLIASVGLRWDLWDTHGYTYNDMFSPFKYDTVTTKYSETTSAKSKTPIIGRLQPRAGISFPVSETTVFHANYGQFMQRPQFQYIFTKMVEQGSNRPTRLGNAGLLPQTTNSYDLGIMQGLGEGFTLDVSGYYKDVKNLIEQADFTSKNSLTYTTYYNRDNADIRGFRVALAKRKGAFTGSLNYHYSVATGKSSSGTDAYPVMIEQANGSVKEQNNLVPKKDILLDFDRTHNFIINLAYSAGDEFGPEVFGVYPFENLIISSNSFLRSGLPYTSYLNPKLENGARTPAEYNTNLKLTKRVNDFFGFKASFYAEVFNLFNNKILNYNLIFKKQSAGSTNDLKRFYETYGFDDPQYGIRSYNWENRGTPFAVDETIILYSNTPRSFNFGVQIEF